jgi:signal transduction histidine kinase/CheY-like chemotaxis protein
MQANNLKRSVFINVRRKIPISLRSVENFYFLSFAICSAFICLIILTPLLVYINQPNIAWTSAACGLLSFISLLVWRFGKSINLAQTIYQSSITTTILFNAYYSGGVSSPVMVWMGIVPLLPLFSAAKHHWRYIWLFISFSSVFIMYWLQHKGLAPVPISTSQADLALSASMIGLLCASQILLVITVDSANSQTIRNVTQKNEKLKVLSRELQIANSHKDKFLATVSHEMRTPLNVVMGYLGLLKSTDCTTEMSTSYIQGASNAASHLLTVINDLLDYSQIQQNKLSLSPQTINLPQKINEIHSTLEHKAAEQGLSYQIELSPQLPQWISIDPHRLTQILLNVLGNALKFTESGSVSTKIFYYPNQDTLDSSGTLHIQINDTGIGIAPEFIDKIFDPFVQVNSLVNQDNSLRGNGLGLAITQSLINNLNGKISIRSELKIGSSFEIELPVKLATAPVTVQQEIITPQTHSNHIFLLIVDDHAVNRLVASATIKRSLPNAIIHEAKNGSEAIEKMKINHYDLVLMDLIMPDYSGVEVVRIIREQCAPPYSNVPVIALTANATNDAIKECQSVGMLDLLPKPFDTDVLINNVLKYSL